jgi:hypothetical protein
MRIMILPVRISYANLPAQLDLDALDFGIAIARHISLTPSPVQDPGIMALSRQRLDERGPVWTSHPMGDGRIFDIITNAEGDMLIQFPPSTETQSTSGLETPRPPKP